MKMIYISCNVSVRARIAELLEEQDIKGYQVVEPVTAKNPIGPPRFNNAVWPGYNTAFFIQITEQEKVDSLMDALREFNRNAFNEEELVVAATWSMEDYIYGAEFER